MITRNRILFGLGLLIVLLPFLGFPSSYESVFSIIFGLAVVFLAFLYARDKRMAHGQMDDKTPNPTSGVYVQNKPVSNFEDRDTDGESEIKVEKNIDARGVVYSSPVRSNVEPRVGQFISMDAIKERSRRTRSTFN